MRSNWPVDDTVMNAVRNPSPPKQMFVVMRSSVATKSTTSPAGEITVIPPFTRVATQMLPAASTASESNSW